MTDVQVRARIAHDAYHVGETYTVDAGRAQRLASAGLVHHIVDTAKVKGARRGTRKARPGGTEQDDQGSVPAGAGDSGASGDEPG